MGTRVCSSKGTWPGHRAFADPGHRKTVSKTWGVPTARLPTEPGPGPVGIVDAMETGDVDVCWTVATNPVAGMPDARRAREAFDDVFLVAQDAFRAETVEYADVVLPAATWGESSGTVTNMERTVSRVTAASDLLETVRQDLDIIAAIGNRIEPGLFPEPPLDPEAVFDELRGLTAGTTADLSGITYDRLKRELGVRWPAPDESTEGGYRYHDDGAWTFPTDSGRARVSLGLFDELPEPTDETYHLTLTTGRRPDAYNTGVRTRGGPGESVPVARLHPETIAAHIDALARGRTVVRSRRAAVAVTVQPDDSVPPDVVWMDIHNTAVNELTLPEVDPESDEPNFKQCAVALKAPDVDHPLTVDGLSIGGPARTAGGH